MKKCGILNWHKWKPVFETKTSNYLGVILVSYDKVGKVCSKCGKIIPHEVLFGGTVYRGGHNLLSGLTKEKMEILFKKLTIDEDGRYILPISILTPPKPMGDIDPEKHRVKRNYP